MYFHSDRNGSGKLQKQGGLRWEITEENGNDGKRVSVRDGGTDLCGGAGCGE